MSRLPAPLDGLLGLRLALYDEALSAGPLGIGHDLLLARVAEEAQRMGLHPAAQQRDLEWLVAARLLEHQDGRYRARRKEDAVAEQAARQPAAKPAATAPATPSARPTATAQLRTPLFTPRQRRDGQGTFF